MDEQRFDQLSRRFAAFRTRRQAIKAIAGAVVATVAGTKAMAVQGATALPCTQHYSPCGSDGECCAGAVCEFGICMPGCRIEGAFYSPWSMPAGDICQHCDPELSTTAWSPANEGMSCWSGDPNAGVTTCQNGACTGSTQQSCPPPTACHLEGEVDPATGMCVNPPAPEGTLCGIGPMCHGGFYQPADTCDGAGFCIGGGSRVVSCFPYECGTDGCLTSCSSNDHCQVGYACVNGACSPGRCDNTVLSGSSDPNAGISIDDILTVTLNGVTMHADPASASAGVRAPVNLGTTINGDQLQVIGRNSSTHCGYRSIGPLYVHCLDNGAGRVQMLDDGYSGTWEGFVCAGNVFYDSLFSLAL